MFENYAERYARTLEVMQKLGQGIPKTMKAFSKLQQAATKEGELDIKLKKLIALGIAVSLRCDEVLAPHLRDAIKAGANRQEIMETISVAILLGGEAAVMYGCEAYELLEQFENGELSLALPFEPGQSGHGKNE